MRSEDNTFKEVVREANPLEEVVSAMTGHSATGERVERRTLCPFHDDHDPSLRINVEKQVWHCDVCGFGGDVFGFVERLRECDFKQAQRELADRAGLARRPVRTILATHDYRDEHGTLLYQKVRFEPKSFQLRRPNGRAGWIYNLNGVGRVLYRLPELKGEEEVVLVEGEKDADALWERGIPATTTTEGANRQTTWRPEYVAQLKSAGIRYLAAIPDNDDPGRAYAEAAVRGSSGFRVAISTPRGGQAWVAVASHHARP